MASPVTTLSSDFITLANGPTLPLEVVCLAIDIEIRGFSFRSQDGKLMVRSENGSAALTDSERQSVSKWKTHLLEVVSYCEATSQRDKENNLSRKTQKKTTRQAI